MSDRDAGEMMLAQMEDDLAEARNHAHGVTLDEDIANRLAIDPQDLEDAFIKCGANIAYLGARYARALKVHKHAERRAKKLRAFVFIEKRQLAQKMHGSGRGGATEELIKSMVEIDTRVDSADVDLVDADVALAQAKTDLQAMLGTKDMLIQMGATRRAEAGLDPSIRAHNREVGRRAFESD